MCQLEVHMLEKLSVQFAQILGNGDQTLFFLGFYFTFSFTLNVNILCVTRHSYGHLIDCSLFILIACG